MNQKAFRQLLQEQLAQAKLRRPGYSLRAFALKAGVSPSVISEILSGKRKVSPQMAQKILQRFCISPADIQRATDLSGTRYAELNIDHFNMVAEWHHMALLSLMETEDFKSDPQWIATRLGITTQKAAQAIERLEKLGLIKTEKGKYIKTESHYKSPDEISSLAIRKWHADHLENAIRSLELDDLSVRDFIGMTLAIQKSHIPLAKKKIRNFLEKLSDELETGNKEEVYQFNFQMFPLSK